VTKIGFEDGTTDGWNGQAQVVTLQNSTAFAAEGTHSLLVTLHQVGTPDFPYLQVDASQLVPPTPPVTGQTVSVWVYVPDTTISLQGRIGLVDSSGAGSAPAMVPLTSGKWNELTFVVPANNGGITGIFVQFNSRTPGVRTINLYMDAVGWTN
jgi:hypothetical protein